MQAIRRALTLCLIGAIAGLPAGALAQGQPTVASAYPLVPISFSATSVEVGFDVSGPVTQVRVTAAGQSAAAGAFAALNGVIVQRDQAGAIAFHVLVPLTGAFPPDGILDVTAVPLDASGTEGQAHTLRLDARAPPPSAGVGLSVRTDSTASTILLDVPFAGPVVSGEISLIGASSQELRRVAGNLKDAEGKAFALARHHTARPLASSAGHLVFAVPVLTSAIPYDGVVIADVALRDAFGRTVHTSAVEFTGGTAFDPVLGLTVSPSPLLLSQGFGQRQQLTVVGQFGLGGDVDLSGAGQGVSYQSLDEEVAVVSSTGVVLARANGETDINVGYAGSVEQVHVIVDSNAVLHTVQILPAGATVPRVGGSLQLTLEGALSDGRLVDLTPGSLGTLWTSTDPSTLTVTPDGRVTSRRPGSTIISAQQAAYTATSRVDSLDGPPLIQVSAPGSVAAGSTFSFAANATDDIQIDHVDFLVNGVPTSTLRAPPFVLQLQAPPFSGATMKLSAVAVDSNQASVSSAVLTVTVTSPPAPSSKSIVYEVPQAGGVAIEGLPQVIRLTSGAWMSGGLSTMDFQVVKFFVNDAPIGTNSVPRVEIRPHPVTGQGMITPLWEMSYVPAPGTAGTSAVIRADGVDGAGMPVRGSSLLILIAPNTPPLVKLSQPAGPTANATVGVPLRLAGAVMDDTISFGVDVVLLADGTAVDQSRVSARGLNGTSSGSAGFSFNWTPPPSSLGHVVNLQLHATDVGGVLSTTGVQITVQAQSPPQIGILTPVSQSSLTVGSALSLTASVNTQSPDPVQVTWTVDGALVGVSSSPPYLVSYPLPASVAGKTLTISATALDSGGNSGSATSTVFATADTAPPSCALVIPRDDAAVVDSIDLLVSAAGIDNVGVTRVEILFDGVVVFDDRSPAINGGVAGSFMSHAVVKAARLLPDGDHQVGARAYDASGNVGTAPNVLIHTHADTPPTAAFLKPAPGGTAYLGTALEVLVEADDDVAVTLVQLFADGVSIGSRQSPPFAFTLPLSGAARTLALRAVATDSSGQAVEASSSVQLTQNTQAPLVAFRSPLGGSKVFAG
ncbi:MAG: Ig-like domain-containing protein, partial [Myxococcaceae bacterium]